jgi:hypothetical protein
VNLKSISLFALTALAAGALYGQPTNGPVYWSTDSGLACPDVEGPVEITNSSGSTVGYSCYFSGVFVWTTAGGEWSSAIRVSAPGSNPIGVDYSFYDTSGNPLPVKFKVGSGPDSGSSASNDVNFSLAANQPGVVNLPSASGGGPATQQTGSAYVYVYCPDDITCALAEFSPQLIYSALPSVPWSLSVPIALDGLDEASTQWSAEGIDDGSTNTVSLVIYNENASAETFKVEIYNSSGTLVGTGTTPSIAGANSTTGEGGTYGQLLRDIPGIGKLPSGIFKIVIDGGTSNYSEAEVLQVTGQSATALQVEEDCSSATCSAFESEAARRAATKLRPKRVPPAVKGPFPAYPQQ